VVGDPSCATADDGAGYVTCAARGGSNALYGIQLDPRIKYSSGYQNLGGVLAGDPSCASPNEGSGQVICAAVGGDNALYSIEFEPRLGRTSGYQYLGGLVSGKPSCSSFGGLSPAIGVGCVVRGAQGTDSALYGIEIFTGGATGYRSLGGIVEGDPGCAGPDNGLGVGMIVCAVRGTDNALYDTAY